LEQLPVTIGIATSGAEKKYRDMIILQGR